MNKELSNIKANLNVGILVALYNSILDIYDFIDMRKGNILNDDSIEDKLTGIDEDKQIQEYQDEIYYLRKFIKHLQIEGIIGGNSEE